ncbi:sacsin N-terminal ATP-binding-like domain-containing protein [Georgenia muralis]
MAEHSQAPGMFGEVARMEAMLADTYRNRVQYELLQNSDDAGARTVAIETTTPGQFSWANDGRPMTRQDIVGLCRSASSVKQRGDAIGYRGIGFKSLAAVASKVTVASAGVEFDFDRAASAAMLGEVAASSVPLIRIPTAVRTGTTIRGARFQVHLSRGADLTIDPTAVLFLRNIEEVQANGPGTSGLRVRRGDTFVEVETAAGTAQFATVGAGEAQLALPLNPAARALTGPTGRLACFLPLEEAVGLPVIISGDVTTDPSRTHAVLDDETTQRVLADAAAALAAVLIDPGAPMFDQLWHLLLQGEDPRAVLMGATRTPASTFLTFLRHELATNRPPFALFPVPLTDAEAHCVFPSGAPGALYLAEHKAAARALRSALGLPSLTLEQVAEIVDPERLGSATRTLLAQQFADNARVHGRAMTPAEKAFAPGGMVGASTLAQAAREVTLSASNVPVVTRAAPRRDNDLTLPAVVARWRVAERAVVEWLNARGWKLEDVSKQNLGYDAAGLDPSGERICLEIKKVDRPDAPFAMTTNEWALMQSRQEPMLIAILIGDERHSRLVLFDPIHARAQPERIARQWEWRFEDWSRHVTTVE